MPTVIALQAPSGTGKTTLLTAIIPHLRSLGLRVGAVKHSHHTVEPDQPGKDSYRLRQAGAEEVILATGKRWALFAETPLSPKLDELLERLDPTLDLILIEGFGGHPLPHIRLHRAGIGDLPTLDDPWLIALATDHPVVAPCPVLALNDPEGVARFIQRYHRRTLEENTP